MTSLLQFGSTGAFRQRGAGGAGQLRADGDGAGGVAVRVVRPAAVLALVPRPEVRDGERHPACPFVVRDHLVQMLYHVRKLTKKFITTSQVQSWWCEHALPRPTHSCTGLPCQVQDRLGMGQPLTRPANTAWLPCWTRTGLNGSTHLGGDQGSFSSAMSSSTDTGAPLHSANCCAGK